MHLTYGGYSHAENEVWLNITRKITYSPRGRKERQLERWDIFGVVLADTESALTSAMQAMEAAYAVDGQDLLFYGNSSGLTRHVLYSAASLNGTRVQQFNWLPGNRGIWGSGTEYVNKRSYQIVVLAEFLLPTDNLYFYRSTIAYTGTTGPKKVWMPSLLGVPQQQIVQAYTTQRVTQTGMNIGLYDYVPGDDPLFGPQYEHLDRRHRARESPREVGVNQSLKFPTRWAYFFEAPIPLI